MLYRRPIFWIGITLLLLPASALAGDEYAQARQQMVAAIEQDVRETSLYLDREALDPRVMTAIARVPGHVYSIEIIEELGEQAAARLSRLGYDNVTTRIGDGYYGWEEHAPFDAIVVTAAASHVPPPLVAQLKPGGRMVIPVGSRFLTQQLVLIEKDPGGQLITRQILPVMFVPLTGEHD